MKRRTLSKFRARNRPGKPAPGPARKTKPRSAPSLNRNPNLNPNPNRNPNRPPPRRRLPSPPHPPEIPPSDPPARSHDHHSVYVVLLDPAVRRLRGVAAANRGAKPEMPCVYVGMTGLTPEERFENHRRGLKAAYAVRRYGVRLLPELFTHLNPMPFEAAAQMERDLAEDLRRAGYTVTGGH